VVSNPTATGTGTYSSVGRDMEHLGAAAPTTRRDHQAVTQISCQRFAFASESSLRLPCVFVSVSVPSAQLPNCPSVCVCGGASARVFVKARIAVLQLLRSEIAEPGEK